MGIFSLEVQKALLAALNKEMTMAVNRFICPECDNSLVYKIKNNLKGKETFGYYCLLMNSAIISSNESENFLCECSKFKHKPPSKLGVD